MSSAPTGKSTRKRPAPAKPRWATISRLGRRGPMDEHEGGGAPLGGSMTKAELVEEVSRVSDLTKKHSEIIVDTVFKSIIDALHRGEKIELRGFGSFRLRRREPRKGRNPKTGDKVDVPPKK